jgi:hypothetical protein
MVIVLSGLTSKPVGQVSRFVPQNWQLRFGDLGVKITATVSCFASQKQVDDGLSVAPQNRREHATAWGMPQDLAACFTCKKVRIWFLSFAAEA